MEKREMVPVTERQAGLLRPLETLERLTEDLFGFQPMARMESMLPEVDMNETEREIRVSVALPGVDKKDIRIDVSENTLSISCERKEESGGTGRQGYRFREQRYGKFYRSFSLPQAVKAGDVRAAYKNGVLSITMPKQKESKTYHVDIA